MEFVHEITAFLENKPGRLAKICSALAHEKVDLRALSVMDTNGRSVLRFVTDQLEATRKVLTSLGTEFTTSEVLAVEMENRPGALARVLEHLAEEHINIEYAYLGGLGPPGRSLGIFHTSNPKRALQVLADARQRVGATRRNAGRCIRGEMATDDRPSADGGRFHVVLVEPEIAGNVGAIGRTCVAAGATLWLVRPLGFLLDRSPIRRAGLDYWPHLDLRVVDHLDEVVDALGPDRLWSFSTKASRVYTDATFARRRPGLRPREPRPPATWLAARRIAPCGSRSGPRRGA